MAYKHEFFKAFNLPSCVRIEYRDGREADLQTVSNKLLIALAAKEGETIEDREVRAMTMEDAIEAVRGAPALRDIEMDGDKMRSASSQIRSAIADINEKFRLKYQSEVPEGGLVFVRGGDVVLTGQVEEAITNDHLDSHLHEMGVMLSELREKGFNKVVRQYPVGAMEIGAIGLIVAFLFGIAVGFSTGNIGCKSGGISLKDLHPASTVSADSNTATTGSIVVGTTGPLPQDYSGDAVVNSRTIGNNPEVVPVAVEQAPDPVLKIKDFTAGNEVEFNPIACYIEGNTSDGKRFVYQNLNHIKLPIFNYAVTDKRYILTDNSGIQLNGTIDDYINKFGGSASKLDTTIQYDYGTVTLSEAKAKIATCLSALGDQNQESFKQYMQNANRVLKNYE